MHLCVQGCSKIIEASKSSTGLLFYQSQISIAFCFAILMILWLFFSIWENPFLSGQYTNF